MLVAGYFFKDAEDTSGMKYRSDAQMQERIHKWITPYDHVAQQRKSFQRVQPGTGKWFLDSDEFQNWLKERNLTLFCPGIPGAGKTTLTASVVDYLQSKYQSEDNIGIAYIYFDYGESHIQNAENLIASILRQLVEQQSSLHNVVKALQTKAPSGIRGFDHEEVLYALNAVVSSLTRVFIVVDALDECLVADGNQPSGANRIGFLEIFALQRDHGANLLATSRPIDEITSEFEHATVMEIRARDDDVRRYLEGNKYTVPKFIQQDENLWKKITMSISEAAGGMRVPLAARFVFILTSNRFLLACIYFEALICRTCVGDIENDLERIFEQRQAPIQDRLTEAYNPGFGKNRKPAR
jgi:hypothetical protein